MGNIASWAAANPDTVKHWEQSLGLPADGVYDPELQKKIENYQLLLNQTPGTTADDDKGVQWSSLNQLLDERAAGNNAPDTAPMRDTAFQAFMRESGAQENQLLDDIAYRTTQNNRDINLRAAGFEAQRAETKQNNAASLQQGLTNIRNDYNDRGFVGSSAEANTGNTLATDTARKEQQQIGAIDEQALQFNNEKRNALADYARTARGDIAGMYRKRVEEGLTANDRVRLNDAQMKYPNG